ncbi:NEW3 domain-containing protein [Chloroflexota bacterium]
MKMVRLVCCCLLLFLSLAAVIPSGTALAQTPTLIAEEKVEDNIEISPSYPRMESIAGSIFEFEVEFRYTSAERFESREFLLRTIAPQGWEVYMTPPFEKEKKLSAIRLTPGLAFGDKIRVYVSAPFWPLPDPGEYPIEVEATSKDGALTGATDLTAVITAKYFLSLAPVAERYNTTADTGEDNFFEVKLTSLSTAPVENINFSSTKPEGWLIEFSPDKIESLEPMSNQTIKVNIKPPTETIAGDYVISFAAAGVQASVQNIEIRVTAETPTIWGWVGVIIILIVVAGLVLIFMRFSRR